MVDEYEVELRFVGDHDFAGTTETLTVPADEYVLAAARSAGVWLAADCQQGWCTTCAARLLDGEVDQTNAKRYFPEDEAAGFVLTCTAKPRSDLKIEVGHQRELLEERAEHGLPPGEAKL